MSESEAEAEAEAEARWMREAWALIATYRDVEQDGDRERWTIDGMPVTDGQVVELTVALDKELLAVD